MDKSLLNLKKKRILITGHTGFKGAWLSMILKNLNAKLYGISLKAEKNSLFEKAQISKIFEEDIICDLRNKKILTKNLKKIKPEIIIHLAAQSLVLEGFKNPVSTLETNFNGTLNILEYSRNVKNVKKILIVTTDKVYETSKNLKYKETDRLFGKDPYSASKVCAEQLTYTYIQSYFNNLTNSPKVFIARSGNVIGGGDISKHRIVPDIIRSIKKRRKLLIRNPENIRPWQHILDPIYGYLLLISKNDINKKDYAWNFGPLGNNFKNVLHLVKKFSLKFKINYEIKKNKSLETRSLKLNSIKSMKKLKWKPKLNFNNAINKIIEFEILSKKNNCFEVCQKQIKDYLEIL